MENTNMSQALEHLYIKYFSPLVNRDDITDDDWDFLSSHIETHKYLLNEKYKNTISFSRAYDSWLEYVVEPFMFAVKSKKVLDYTNLNIVKLFRDVSERWHYLKERIPKEYKNIGIHNAVDDFCFHNDKYPFFKKIFIKTF